MYRGMTWFYLFVQKFSLTSAWRTGHSSLDKGYNNRTVKIGVKRVSEDLSDRLDVVFDRNGRAREWLGGFGQHINCPVLTFSNKIFIYLT